jgi:hypothetical protein
MRFWPLTEHWNGVKWTIGPHVPWSVAPDSQLPLGFTVVAAAPPDDVLALAPLEAEVWRFNRTAWEQGARAPQFAGGLAVIAHEDAWIVGPASGEPTKPVAYHWDGQTWQPTQLPAAGLVDAVSASAPDDVWAVGRLSPTGTQAPLVADNTVILHFAC